MVLASLIVQAGLQDLQLLGVTKRFGTSIAVDSLSLEVAPGEYLCLLGPSGCGKTTTLRMVAGLASPDSGRVVVRDADVTDLPAHRRPVNTVFQHYALFPHLTVAGNVGFGLRVKGKARAAIRHAVGEMLDLVSLHGYEERWPLQLSGGEQQRVALARALINQPIVVLLDEPLGALDRRLRDQMQRELKGIQKRAGVTFIHVTHDQEEAMTLADRIAVMQSGRLVQLDTPRAIYDRPATQFVASFVGEMNFMSGTVVGHQRGMLQIDVPGGSLLRASPRQDVSIGSSVVVGVRPEKISLTADPVRLTCNPEDGAAGANVLEGVIRDFTYLGMRTQMTLAVGPAQLLTVVSTDATAGLPPGTKVTARWPATETIVFQPSDTYVMSGR